MSIFKCIKHSTNARLGFTLAEVLITLGIIGVVAALTIPTLINNYQKTQYITGLKKAYQTLTNGFKLYMVDSGVDSIADTDLFDGVTAFTDASRQDKTDAVFKKYFKTFKTCKNGDTSCTILNGAKDLSGNIIGNSFDSQYNFYTADGMAFRVTLETACQTDNSIIGQMKGNCGNIWVDVNGTNKPNQYGKDYFLFWLAPNGNVYPSGGQDYAKFSCGASWQTCASYWVIANECFKGVTAMYSGFTCSGRAMEEGWQLNYF